MSVKTARQVEDLGEYVDRAGVRHRVCMRRVGARTWEISDVPERGDPVVIDRLEGELESRDTAAAVAHDYLSQSDNSAA